MPICCGEMLGEYISPLKSKTCAIGTLMRFGQSFSVIRGINYDDDVVLKRLFSVDQVGKFPLMGRQIGICRLTPQDSN